MKKFITYQLFIEVTEFLTLTVGKLGKFDFPAGHYVYTGSAKANLEARIARHLSKDKKLKWHIDYLLNAPGVHVTQLTRSIENECACNQNTPGNCLVAKFGASDCRSGCISHLKYQA